MSDSKTKGALVQMRCGANPEENFSRALKFIRDAARQGAQIVCLPELFRSQYFCQTEDHKNFELAEPVPGRSTSALGNVARETNIVIVASLFEKRSAGLYHNTAVIIDENGEVLGKYRKMHIPDDPLYHEKFYFAPGDLLSYLNCVVAASGISLKMDRTYGLASGSSVIPRVIFCDTAESSGFSKRR